MNEYPFPIVCGLWDNGGGLFMCMNSCMNVCISLYMYVDVHACMCVRPANDFINVKAKTK